MRPAAARLTGLNPGPCGPITLPMLAIAILLGAVGLWPLVRRPLAVLFLRGAVSAVAKDISDQALAKLPDRIRLVRRDESAWRDPAAAATFAAPLVDAGFEDAGTFAIEEMPGVSCRLLVDARDSIAAVVYEHPKVGVWLELVSRFVNGDVLTYSTRPPTGMEPRPGHTANHAPGKGALELLERMRSDRPLAPLQSLTVATYPRTFESGYAEAIAWRKRRGVTAKEIARVAENRKAA